MMANKLKKVLFVIVEGESDGLLFFDELEKVYPKDLLVIKAFRGDIFTQLELQGVGIRDRIRDFFISKMGDLQPKDFLGILHFSDTDGSFVGEDKVYVDLAQKEAILYKNDGIYVNTTVQKLSIHHRNQIKKTNTNNAKNITQITYKKVQIPYSLFYLSQEVEHVIFDELNVSQNLKIRKMVTFLKKVRETQTINDLLKSHFPPLAEEVTDKYKESWDYIFNADHSLQRCTNAILMYEYIDKLLSP
ncbi:hypothetical protein LOZ80_25815 [Paenibacillus sp. HWE-109]|uniref:hypothetical protein n=1 Tax=Paenibacillus sp. HWE-109 TaxID=1306526 RepID=UPI001EE0DF3F|nr:hypothetical protein [Paenibacillus sp. HWE-109]UKS24998.1 hypothetical protein LOZ80_25815 [Paenibacillus sp. HWE-109]